MEGALDETAAAAAVERWGLTPKNWKQRQAARHIFTHVEWHMSGYILEVAGSGPADFLWVDADGLARHAVPSAFAKYYAAAEKELREE